MGSFLRREMFTVTVREYLVCNEKKMRPFGCISYNKAKPTRCATLPDRLSQEPRLDVCRNEDDYLMRRVVEALA